MDQEQLLRTLFTGFIRIHILHHCAHRPWFGQELMEELSEHGYKLSYGTLYPVLHDLEKSGWLTQNEELVGGRWRKYYQTSTLGREVLALARKQVDELSEELEEDHED